MHSVLVVDDYEDTRELLEVVLSGRGYRVFTASDGAEGVRVAREARPNVIVMDLFMPGMDGFEATRLLKDHEDTSATPVIAYTARPSPLGRHEALFAAVCRKPCPPDILLGLIRDVLTRYGGSPRPQA